MLGAIPTWPISSFGATVLVSSIYGSVFNPLPFAIEADGLNVCASAKVSYAKTDTEFPLDTSFK